MPVVNNYRVVAVLPSILYYGNSVLTINNSTELVNNFGEPTNDNYKYWFQIYNYLKYSKPIDVIKPIDIYYKNSVLVFDNSVITNETIADFYNPEVANLETVTVEAEKLKVIRKLPDEDDNLAFLICSEESKWKEFVHTSSSKRWCDYFDIIPLFSANEIACLVLKKSGDYWILAEKMIVSLNPESDIFINNYESSFVYMKSNNFVPFTTNDFDIEDLKFIQSAEPLTETNDAIYTRALNIVKELKYNIILDFCCPDDTNINRVSSLFLEENIIIITGLWNESRYSDFNNRINDIVNDFGILSALPTGYFNVWNSNTFLVGNMKRQYDEYNGFYRIVPCFGDIAGIFSLNYGTPYLAGFKYGLIKHIEKLLVNPGELDVKLLLDNKINPIIYDLDYSGKYLLGDRTSEKNIVKFRKTSNVINHYQIIKDLNDILEKIVIQDKTNKRDVERFVSEARKYLESKKKLNIVSEYSLTYLINNDNNVVEYSVSLTYPTMIEEIIVNIREK